MATPIPETRYALSGDVSIAYQVFGSGPLDLVIVPGFISHVDLLWQEIGYHDWMDRLASFARVIVFDKRGTGASDRDVGDSTLEDRMDDLRAVLDAAGSERSAVMGISEGGALAVLYAAAYPARVSELILFASFACSRPAADYPEGAEQDALFDRLWEHINGAWGAGEMLRHYAPRSGENQAARTVLGRFERAASSPRAVRSHIRWVRELDVRPVAQALRVRTLVALRDGDATVAPAATRWFARNIPGARLVEYHSDYHLPWNGNAAAFADDIQEFVTGSRHTAPEPDRVLATVLFTDIVRSTERAIELGDRAWIELLALHHDRVRAALQRFRGREENTSGDGFLASFDGPARAVRCALEIRDTLAALGIEVRAGVHTGECERHGTDLAGIAVHIGARVMAAANAGEVIASRVVRDLVAGSGLVFAEHGLHELKGIPGSWELYRASAR